MTESLLTCSKKMKSAYIPHQHSQEQVAVVEQHMAGGGGADRNQELYFGQTDCYPSEDIEKTRGRRLEMKWGEVAK